MTRPPADFAHTAHAEQNRARKAEALAASARALGADGVPLLLDVEGRAAVRRHAGVGREPSEETWAVVLAVLGVSACRLHPGRPGRLYLSGWCCEQECAPWRRAGHPAPVPPPGTTLLDLYAARGQRATAPSRSATVVDERAVLSGKRRSTESVYQATRAASEFRAKRSRRGGAR